MQRYFIYRHKVEIMRSTDRRDEKEETRMIQKILAQTTAGSELLQTEMGSTGEGTCVLGKIRSSGSDATSTTDLYSSGHFY